jgi:glutaconate CoA-transferase subunit A
MVWPAGSDLPTLPGFPPAGVDPITGDRIANVAAIRPDVLLLHAQAADAEGNIEIYGARGVDPTVVCAAREVLVTVEEVVDRGSLGTRPHSVVLPKHLITAIAVVPGGSGPTSCLPYRCADYGAIARWIAQPSLLASVPGGQTASTLDHIGVQEVSEALEVVGHDGEPSLDEWMTCWLANQYDNDSICSVGAVSPLASASYLLAKATHAPDLTLITNGGGYIDVESRPLLLGLGEWLDACSAVTHAGGDETYELYYQPGLVTHEVVSVAQIDGEGRTNNREVTSPSGRRVRLPGQGGMADVSNMHRDFMIYLPRQSPLNTPQRVDFSTAARGLLSDAERTSAGLQPGRVRLVTNLAVFELTAEQPSFAIKEVFPWTTYEELAAATGFALDVPDLAGIPVVAGPTPQQLHALRSEVDPMGIRRLEFVPSRDRTPLLDEILAADARLMATLVVGGSDA